MVGRCGGTVLYCMAAYFICYPAAALTQRLWLLLAEQLIFFNIANGQVIYYHTFSVIGDMVIGGITAWLAFCNKKFSAFIASLSKKIIIVIYVLGGLLIIFNYKIFTNSSLLIFERLVYALFFAFVIAEQNFATHSFYKMSNNKFLHRDHIYGLRPLHYFIIFIISESLKILSSINVLVILHLEFGCRAWPYRLSYFEALFVLKSRLAPSKCTTIIVFNNFFHGLFTNASTYSHCDFAPIFA
jgi:hypothetical protein